ncbi:MAG: asparagine--tRNA ligase [Bdellovibrionota bacterium]
MATKDRFYISDAAKVWSEHQSKGGTGNPLVTIRGWVYQKRSSGKIKFLIVRDGTAMIQGVLVKGECDDKSFDDFERLTQESSIIVTGLLKEQPRSPGSFELAVKSIEVHHLAESYPISPKEHGVEFLMENRHLWVRSSKQHAALRVRWEIIKSIREFFDSREFVLFDAPILTPSACEGTSTLFSTPYFDSKAYLTQSGQLYGEVGAMAFGKVYVFGPTFRAEKSKTRKHLTEFWMVEPEMAWYDLDDNMALAEQFVEYIVQSVLARRSAELKTLERDLSKLEKIRGPFPRISYKDSLKVLERRGVGVPYGEDFGAPQETALGEEFGGMPVFVHRFPQEIKAFYFKRDQEDPNLALGCDLIAPDGYGEIIGGGQREEDYNTLVRRIEEHKLPAADYQWYLDLRRYGSVPHSGFGLGVERTVAWICGLDHVRETIPFPRMIHTLRP